MLKLVLLIVFLSYSTALYSCRKDVSKSNKEVLTGDIKDSVNSPELSPNQLKVLEGAKQTLADGYRYDMSMAYYTIPFPQGDIDPSIGVCTDVIIRTLRLAGIADLQLELNKDIKANWNKYPMKRWNAKKADPNIDHRRVMNLKVWLERNWQALNNKEDFQPGDIVIWDMNKDGASDHIGIVSDNLKVIHNHPDPGYVAEEDKLFLWEITGHYRVNE